MQDNIQTFSSDAPLSQPELEALDRVRAGLHNMIPCTACRYCTDDCPMGINIPEFLKYYNKYKVDGDMGLKQQLEKVESISTPLDCLSCGSCSSHCPQGIDIPSIMTEMGEKFY